MVQSARRSILGSIANENRQIMSSGCSCDDSEATTPEPFEAGCDCDYTPHDAERAACGTGGCAVPTSPSSRTVQNSSTTLTGGLTGMSAASGQAQTALVDMFSHDAGYDNTSGGVDYGMIDGALDETMGAAPGGTSDFFEPVYNGYGGQGPCMVTKTSPPPYSKFTEPDEYYAWWQGCDPRGIVGPGAEAAARRPMIVFEALYHCHLERRRYLTEAGLPPPPSNSSFNYVVWVWVGPSWVDSRGVEHISIIDASCMDLAGSDPALGLGGTWVEDPSFVEGDDLTLIWVEDPEDPVDWNVGEDLDGDGHVEAFESINLGESAPIGGSWGGASTPAGSWSEAAWSDWLSGLDPEEMGAFEETSDNFLQSALSNPAFKAALDDFVEDNGGDCSGEADDAQAACMSAVFVSKMLSGEFADDESDEDENLLDPEGEGDPCGPPDYARC